MVPSMGWTTVPSRRMSLMKHGYDCFQLETLANSATKGHLTEQKKTCDVQSTMEISRLQTEVSGCQDRGTLRKIEHERDSAQNKSQNTMVYISGT